MVEIRNLRTLVKIAELGSYTKAAQALGYAQSTLTFQVNAIEAHYGRPVFDRTGKSLRLTTFGSQLLESASDVLGKYEALEQLGKDDATPQGCIRIGAPESLTMYRLFPIIKEYKAAYPQVEIRLIDSPCEMLLKNLSAGQLDISFILQPLHSDPNLHVEELVREQMCMIAPAGHTQEDLLPEPGQMVIYTEKQCSYRQEFDRYLRKHCCVPANILETPSVEAIKNTSERDSVSLICLTLPYAMRQRTGRCGLRFPSRICRLSHRWCIIKRSGCRRRWRPSWR